GTGFKIEARILDVHARILSWPCQRWITASPTDQPVRSTLIAHERTPQARIIGAQFARYRPRWSPNRLRSAQLLPSLLAIMRSTLRSPLDMWSKSLSSFFAGFVRWFCSRNLAALGSPELWNRS